MSKQETTLTNGSTTNSIKSPLWIALIVAIIVLAIGFGLRMASQIQYDHLSLPQKAEVICQDLRAPGDPSTVSESSLGMAYQIRQQVTADLQQGMTKNQVLDAMVNQYGESVLAVPRFRGFGIMTWFAPLVVALIVLYGVFTFIRRSTGARGKASTRAALEASGKLGAEASSGSEPRDAEEPQRVKSRLQDYL